MIYPFLVLVGLAALALYKFGDEARAALGVMPLATDERLRVRPADGVGAGQAGPGALFVDPLTPSSVLGGVHVEVSFSGKAARVVSTEDSKLKAYVGQTYLVG